MNFLTNILTVADRIAETRAQSKAAAAKAGARSTHAAPLSRSKRVDNYRRQNNHPDLTPRQRRRAEKKFSATAAY